MDMQNISSDMAGERNRRSSRVKRSPKDDDSDDPEMSAALQLTRLDGGVGEHNKESDRLAKIQEKNRKAQQKFRERRKEKMLTMEREIQDLNQAVRQLKSEKEVLQEQLAVEKRVNAENSAKLEQKPSSALGVQGMHDFDPIDMSFLPQWEGLSLSNEKIRAMPSETLKMLIQTIMQDLRTRLVNIDSSVSPALGHSVSQAFSFLNRCYLVEPVRYRKVVVEMMSGTNLGSGADSKPHMTLTRDQEMSISSAVEYFEKKCDELWKLRESTCDAIKQHRLCRGSELDNMRAFIQVHGQIESLQDTLRAENEVLVSFLSNVGRVLGPAPLTHAMFAVGGQDIFTFCHAIHCRSLMVNSSGLGSQSQGHHGPKSGAGTGSIPLVDNIMMPRMNDSAAMDLDRPVHPESHCMEPRADSNAMHTSMRSLPAPTPQHQSITHESPFLYGPGEREAAASAENGQAAGGQAAMQSVFRAPKSEPAAGGPAMASGGDFIELFRSIEGQRGDSMRLSAGLRSLLKDVPGSMSLGGIQVEGASLPFPNSRNGGTAEAAQDAAPAALTSQAEIIAGSLANSIQSNPGNPAAMKGLFSLLQQQQIHQQQQGGAQTPAAAGGAGHMQSTGARAPNLAELASLLESKEGSRTLEILAQDLTTTRTLSAGELMSIQPEELHTQGNTQAGGASSTQPESPAAAQNQSPPGQVISGMSPNRTRSAGVVQVTSGQCE